MKRSLLALLVVGLVAALGGRAMAADPKPSTKMTQDLAALPAQHAAATAAGATLDRATSMLPVSGDWVTIDAVAAHTRAAAKPAVAR